MHKYRLNSGFSLMEMIIVIGIIVTMSATGAFAATTLIRNARAAKIVEDFERLNTAWETYRLDTGAPYPYEGKFHNGVDARIAGVPTAQCDTEVSVEGTDIYTDVGLAYSPPVQTNGWSGPYITDKLRDPWGNVYTYDNDGDTYNPDLGSCARTPYGVNIFLTYCADDAQSYNALAEIIDRTIDNSDGLCNGTFRQFTHADGNGLFIYGLAERGETSYTP